MRTFIFVYIIACLFNTNTNLEDERSGLLIANTRQNAEITAMTWKQNQIDTGYNTIAQGVK